MKYTPAQVRKLLVAIAGFVVVVLSTSLAVGGVLPESWLPFVHVVIAVASSYGVFKVKNAEV